MEILKEIQKFCDQMPRATEEQAKEYAESISSHDDEIRDFVAKWKRFQGMQSDMKQAEFQANVKRIWPD